MKYFWTSNLYCERVTSSRHRGTLLKKRIRTSEYLEIQCHFICITHTVGETMRFLSWSPLFSSRTPPPSPHSLEQTTIPCIFCRCMLKQSRVPTTVVRPLLLTNKNIWFYLVLTLEYFSTINFYLSYGHIWILWVAEIYNESMTYSFRSWNSQQRSRCLFYVFGFFAWSKILSRRSYGDKTRRYSLNKQRWAKLLFTLKSNGDEALSDESL